MTTWRRSFDDLEALGILVTAAQKDVVLWGGEVLVIQCLPEPGCYRSYDDFEPALDQYGNLAMVASILRSFPVTGACPGIFHPHHDVSSLGEHINRVIGDGEHWRFWPSYTGNLVNGQSATYFQKREDENDRRRPQPPTILHIERIWSGIPTVSIGNSVAERVVKASNMRVNNSHYNLVDDMCELADHGQLPWDPQVHPDAVHPVEGDMDELELKMLTSLRRLSAEGYWDLQSNQYTSQPLEFPKMSNILGGDHVALGVWDKLVAQSRTYANRARKKIPKKSRPSYSLQERDFEPWL